MLIILFYIFVLFYVKLDNKLEKLMMRNDDNILMIIICVSLFFIIPYVQEKLQE